jgi:hypothetical protein
VKTVTLGITIINAREIVSVMVSEGVSTNIGFISNHVARKNMSSKIDTFYEETLKRKILPFKDLQSIAEKVLGRQVSYKYVYKYYI